MLRRCFRTNDEAPVGLYPTSVVHELLHRTPLCVICYKGRIFSAFRFYLTNLHFLQSETPNEVARLGVG